MIPQQSQRVIKFPTPTQLQNVGSPLIYHIPAKHKLSDSKSSNQLPYKIQQLIMKNASSKLLCAHQSPQKAKPDISLRFKGYQYQSTPQRQN